MDAKFDPKLETWLADVVDIVCDIKSEADCVLRTAETAETINLMASGSTVVPIEVLEDVETDACLAASRSIHLISELINKMKSLVPKEGLREGS